MKEKNALRILLRTKQMTHVQVERKGIEKFTLKDSFRLGFYLFGTSVGVASERKTPSSAVDRQYARFSIHLSILFAKVFNRYLHSNGRDKDSAHSGQRYLFLDKNTFDRCWAAASLRAVQLIHFIARIYTRSRHVCLYSGVE